MRLPLLRLGLLACLLVATGRAAPLRPEALLAAIAEVEGGTRDGAAGERGPWQCTAATWAMHMPGRPFAEARQHGPARVCAERHLAWLRRGLRRAGRPDDARHCALAWNAGLARVLRGEAPRAARDYAQRVVNLYEEAAP